jgi:hypothetical protein
MFEGINPRVMPVAEGELQGIAPHRLAADDFQRRAFLKGREGEFFFIIERTMTPANRARTALP